MNIQLSDHFTYRRLIRFTISTVLMLICTSMYSIVDGLFVSNYVGKMPFAATNLIWPVSMGCLLYTSPSPRDVEESRMPSSA